jgi:predicted lipoprotein with Yx(FWY)xxD motif
VKTRLESTRSRLLSLVLAIGFAAIVLTLSVAAASGSGGATIKTHSSSLGKILVDARGRTLYLFEKDKGHRSSCYGQCAAFWPPALANGKPTAAGGAKASLLGTIRRKNGSIQVTYAGHPLYRYVADTKPGQTTGEGSQLFGAGWDVLSPSGKKIEKD